MRLDNGAINCAGQGHNEGTAGVDRTAGVCITLCQNELSTGITCGCPERMSWRSRGKPPRDPSTVMQRMPTRPCRRPRNQRARVDYYAA
ncbi:hypothetical protein NFA_4340 [Nocardia farcinica IFM 10152]|uniref:Uncharacterized protein n=1 Tax=Nocardia farcinica (strain IFM 10152) TaxID=247156 RepID=Q5Z2R5_NOCFA|nr:hypothetical protein NFA_4340 [Nocardia farcinica IFM 10152]